MDNSKLMEQFLQINALMRQRRHQMRAQYGPMFDPHYGQGRVISLLAMQPEITQKELGYLLGMRPQSLSELLAKLEEQALITRSTSEKDRRMMVITLTEKGKEAAMQTEAWQPNQEEIFDFLSNEEQESLYLLLEKVIETWQEQADSLNLDERAYAGREMHHGRRGGMYCGRGQGKPREGSHSRKGHHLNFQKQGRGKHTRRDCPYPQAW